MILLLNQPHIDFNILLSFLMERNLKPNKKLDECGVSYNSIRGYVALLDQLRNPTHNPREFPKDFEILSQVSLSFLINDVDPYIICTIETKGMVKSFRKKDFFILSGTLYEWRELFVQCTLTPECWELMAFMGDLYLHFERLDLGGLCQKKILKEKVNHQNLFQLIH